MASWQLQKNKTFFGFFIDKTQNIVYNINIKMKEEKTNVGFNDIFIISSLVWMVFR